MSNSILQRDFLLLLQAALCSVVTGTCLAEPARLRDQSCYGLQRGRLRLPALWWMR